jgi:hypothetical protein
MREQGTEKEVQHEAYIRPFQAQDFEGENKARFIDFIRLHIYGSCNAVWCLVGEEYG